MLKKIASLFSKYRIPSLVASKNSLFSSLDLKTFIKTEILNVSLQPHNVIKSNGMTKEAGEIDKAWFFPPYG